MLVMPCSFGTNCFCLRTLFGDWEQTAVPVIGLVDQRFQPAQNAVEWLKTIDNARLHLGKRHFRWLLDCVSTNKDGGPKGGLFSQ